VKRKRKLDGVLFYMAFAAFVLLSALTITQQFEIWELAKQQTVILVVIDEKLDPIEEKYDVIADIVDGLVGEEFRVIQGVGNGTKSRDSVTTR